MGLGGRLAQAYGNAVTGAEEIRRKREAEERAKQTATIQEAALLAHLRESGIIPQSEQDNAVEMPITPINGGPAMPPARVHSVTPNRERYKPLGNTGYVQDQTASPRAMEIVKQRKRDEMLKRRVAIIKAKQPNLLPDEALALAESDDAFEAQVKPTSPTASEPVEVVMENGQRVYRPRSQVAGKGAPEPAEPLVQVVDASGNTVYVPRAQAAGMTPANKSGGADRRKRLEALGNVSKALDSFEANLSATGATILPSVEQDQLRTDYENLQLQLKELFNLGVLNGPDLALMRRIVQDPTSVTGRARAYGQAGEQTKRTLAQVQKMREKIVGFRQSLEAASNAPVPAGVASPHEEEFSDDEVLSAYNAGKRSDADIAAFIRQQRGGK